MFVLIIIKIYIGYITNEKMQYIFQKIERLKFLFTKFVNVNYMLFFVIDLS